MNESLRFGFSCLLLFFTTVSTQECRSGCPPVHGFCDNTGECRCSTGWEGVTCDQCVPLSGCVHGSCKEPAQCICDPGWSGTRCDRDAGLCSSKPCWGDSTCIETGSGEYRCLCPPGFTGKNCHLKNACLTDGSLCQNGGTCLDTNVSDSSCLCPPGFTGRFCESDSDVCEPNPCVNGGRCTRHDPTFICVCPSPFSGPVCDVTLTNCSGNLCMNGGTCFSHTDGGIHCICPHGLTGPSCELHINQMKSKPRYKAAGAGHVMQHYTIPAHAFHRLLRAPERELLKENAQTSSQLICFTVLGLLTCLVVLVTTGIVFFNRCETWMANVKYRQLLRQQRDFLLRASSGDEHSVNIIVPEKIRLSHYGKGYTSI
ncbi:protein delta homolog 1 [Xyrauchen texanus]|uniref:protein delta homolog 1 n=1 Tax=Xyrauchen texanus TaxID=154827 RepID=UPI0022424B42|nr:protein delta homolog 1 [Xyrauchen texanus]